MLRHNDGRVVDHDDVQLVLAVGELHRRCGVRRQRLLQGDVDEGVAELAQAARQVAKREALERDVLALAQEIEREHVGDVLDDVRRVEALRGELGAQHHGHRVRELPVRRPQLEEGLGKQHRRGHRRIVECEADATLLDVLGHLLDGRVGEGRSEAASEGDGRRPGEVVHLSSCDPPVGSQRWGSEGRGVEGLSGPRQGGRRGPRLDEGAFARAREETGEAGGAAEHGSRDPPSGERLGSPPRAHQSLATRRARARAEGRAALGAAGRARQSSRSRAAGVSSAPPPHAAPRLHLSSRGPRSLPGADAGGLPRVGAVARALPTRARGRGPQGRRRARAHRRREDARCRAT